MSDSDSEEEKEKRNMGENDEDSRTGKGIVSSVIHKNIINKLSEYRSKCDSKT